MKNPHLDVFIHALHSTLNPQEKFKPSIKGLGLNRTIFLNLEKLFSGEIKNKSEVSPDEYKLATALINVYKHFNGNSLNGFKQTYHNLKLSTLNSFFTPDIIIENLVKPLASVLPKQAINVLEPSAGDGRFINSIQSFLPKSNITAIEKEFFTGQILKNKYPGINTIIDGFENLKELDHYDLTISNIPFGDLNVYDKSLNNSKHLFKSRIHNYFFLKAINVTKPGGLIAFITSTGFTDSRSSSELREYLLKRSNLISAIRLHNQTFKSEGTLVTSDIIVLQKTNALKNELSYDESLFVKTNEITINDHKHYLNAYFDENREQLSGPIEEYIFHNAKKLTVTDADFPNINDLGEFINQQLTQNINANFSHALTLSTPKKTNLKTPEDTNQNKTKTVPYPGIIEGGLFIKNSIVYAYNPNDDDVKLNIKDIQKAYSLIELKKSYLNYFIAKKNNQTDLKKLKDDFDFNYSTFEFQYGKLNDKINLDLIIQDSQSDLLLSLEQLENNTFSKVELSNASNSIIENNTDNNSFKVKSIDEAIILSLNKHNRIDLDLIAMALDKPYDDFLPKALQDHKLFINPILNADTTYLGNEISDASTFKSGFIEKKIQLFSSGRIDGDFSEFFNYELQNSYIDVLKDFIPQKLSIDEINPELGEPWIPTEYYQQFASEFFKTDAVIKLSALSNLYHIKLPYNSETFKEYYVSKNRGSVTAKDILDYAMHDNTPDFKKTVLRQGNEVKISDDKVNNQVAIRVDAVKSAFVDWLSNNQVIKNELESIYHLNNNAFVSKVFDGSYLDFSHINTYTPNPHQINGAAHILGNFGGVVDHKVGFGKTLTISLTIDKFSSTGLSKKNLIIGMNANYVKLYEDIKSTLPHLNGLLLHSDDFAPSKKQNALFKIANTNFDFIVIPHSTIDKFPTEPEIEYQIIKEENQNIANDLKVIEEEGFKITPKMRAGLVKKQENNEIRMKTLYDIINAKSRKGIVSFNDLGITHIFVDESHQFKNLAFSTRHTNLSGLGTTAGNQKTSKLLVFCRAMQKKYNADKGVTFLSATILSNSLAELYLLFKYLTPKKLKQLNISSFDQWARTYARKDVKFEQNLIGIVKKKERLRFFVKVPELAKQYTHIAHVADERVFSIDKPNLNTIFMELESYPELDNYMKDLQDFMNNGNPALLHAGKHYTEDQLQAIGLIATNYGRKAALDLRLVNSSLFDFHPNNKINQVAQNIFKVYNDSKNFNGTQFVFCDFSTPKANTFNAYDEIKSILINKGIPETQIAFIHDANTSVKKKDKILTDFNAGKLRILFGSTQKLGTGVNAQQNCIAMHHVDMAWRPSDYDQRNGRGERQGNYVAKTFNNNQVDNYIYGTKGTTDAGIFSLIATKAFFIKQIKDASITTRTIDEGIIDANGNIDAQDLGMLISNDSDFIEKSKLEKDLNLLEQKHKAFSLKISNAKVSLEWEKQDLDKQIKTLDKVNKEAAAAKDFKFTDNQFNPGFNVTLKGQSLSATSYKSFGELLHQKLESIVVSKKYDEPLAVSTDGNFKLVIAAVGRSIPISLNEYKIFVEGPYGLKYSHGRNMLVKDRVEAGKYFKNAISKVFDLPKAIEQKINNINHSITSYSKILNDQNPYIKDINSIKSKIKSIEDKIDKENNKDNDKDKEKEKDHSNGIDI